VFWNCLLELFTHCRQCSGKITLKQHFTQGALLSVTTVCENGHKLQWYSQPKVNKRPEGNILIGGALTLSGILFNQFKAFCIAIKLSMFTRPVFDKIINKYVYPVVFHQWQEHKNATINSIMSSSLPIWLTGDGQFDSPGFRAKYCTYSVMDIHSGKIVDFKLVQKGQVKGNLER